MDLFGIMGKIGEFKTAAADAKARLATMTVDATNADGTIRVTCFGNKQMKEIIFIGNGSSDHPDLVKTINEALDKADQLSKAELKKATAGLIPNIPGLDLSQFGL